MNSVWFPGAARIAGPHSSGLTMAGGNCLLTHHITVSPKDSYVGTRDYLIHEGFEPTLLLDPWFGRRGQFLPGDRGGYALMHPPGEPETNREGRIHIQVEWLSPDMHTDLATGKYFPQMWHDLCVWSHALGVPYEWPFGHPLSTSRDPKLWRRGGHRGHINAPGNNHVDSLLSTRMAWPTATPRPAPIPPKEDDVQRMLEDQRHTPNPVWMADTMERRWITTAAERDFWKSQGVPLIPVSAKDAPHIIDTLPVKPGTPTPH